jgi:hypothetical protein
VFENLPQGLATAGAETMSAMTADFQGLSTISVRRSPIRLNRRGRLARTFVVLSLAVVLGSVVAGQAGAGTAADSVKAAPHSFITVTVAPGESIWSLANRLANGGDVRALISEIQTVNSLPSADLTAGQKIRVPLN